MRVTLLGTGDTTGTPVPGCDCPTCERATDLGVERTRFSVHIENEQTGESLLVDASPDFRTQFLRQQVALPAEAVITHIHFDHLDGLGNVYRLIDHLDVHAADEPDPTTAQSVAGTVAEKYSYLDRVSVHAQTPFEPFEAAGFEVTLVPVDHPPLLCYGVVIEEDSTDDDPGEPPEDRAKLAITGDTSYDIPSASRQAFAKPDLLLADGILPAAACEDHFMGGQHEDEDGVPRTFGTKHMTREGAFDLAEELQAGDLRIVHASHRYPPDEAFAREIAVDGETFDL